MPKSPNLPGLSGVSAQVDRNASLSIDPVGYRKYSDWFRLIRNLEGVSSSRKFNMALELYQEVALTRDLPESELRAGDIATLVDFVAHPNGGEDGCVLEVFNAVGESLTVIAVPISTVEALRPDEILTVRSLAKVG